MTKESSKPSKSSPAKASKKPAVKSVESKKPSEVNDHLHRREMVGLVVSDKMTKTIVVKVDRRIRDTLYKKYVTRSTKYKVHDERSAAKVGDLVSMVESRPLSKTKRWVLTKILRRAGQAPEINI